MNSWDDVVNAAWPPVDRVALPYKRMMEDIKDLVSFIAYGTTDPHVIFVERLRERTKPMFVVHHEEGVSREVVEFMEDYAARMRPTPSISGGSFTVGIDIGLHVDEYQERVDFYDQPCMYAEGD